MNVAKFFIALFLIAQFVGVLATMPKRAGSDSEGAVLATVVAVLLYGTLGALLVIA